MVISVQLFLRMKTMKNKRFIYILLAIILLAGFLYLRNTSVDTGSQPNSVISDVVSEVTDDTGGESPHTGTAEDPGQDGEDIPLAPSEDDGTAPEEETIDEDGVYDSKEDVALYIHTYG